MSFGWFGDHLDKRRVTAFGILLTSFIFIVLGNIHAAGIAFLLPLFIVLSIGYGGPVPMMSALLREYFGTARLGAVIGMAQGIAMIGSVTGQPLAGWMFDTYGNYQAAWLIFGSVMLLGGIIMLTTPKQSHQTRTMSAGSYS